MRKTSNTLDGNTVDVSFDHLGFQAYGNCRRRSSSPFEDYADRHLGSPSYMLCGVFPLDVAADTKAILPFRLLWKLIS